LMNRKIIIAGALLSVNTFYAQQNQDEYARLIKKADSLYNAKDYKASGAMYSAAFKSIGWKGIPNDRYNAACSWAMANVPDSAFFNLERIARVTGYQNYQHLISDEDLKTLHSDKRWNSLTELVKQNKEKAEANLNKPLVAKLDSIYKDDQSYRVQSQELQKKYGWDSKEIKDLWKIIQVKDSLNLIQVKTILDTHGWLGADVIGIQGNSTLFLVIQHADLKTQEKYLPMMQEAVRKGKATGSSLALLEDRIEIRNGRKQIYGSQIGTDPKTKLSYVSPLIDPDNVDKRRAQVGLQPLAEYVKNWDMKWNVEQYKKDLPYLESIQQKY
jgi:hypothetical protein